MYNNPFYLLLTVFLATLPAQAQPLRGCTFLADAPEVAPEEPPEAEQPEEPELIFKGFAANSYGLNFPAPSTSRSLLRGYALDDRKLKLDGINLDFEYGLSGDNQLGFRLDTVLGGSYPRIDAAGGLFRQPYTGYSNTDFDIRQAFLRYSVDKDLSVDVGKFATWVGYEIMPGVDGKNSNATPAYGYTFNPFTHTGVRVNYAPSDQVSLVAAVVLGADNFQDTNRSVSFGGQVNWHPDDRFSLIFNVLDGPEQAYNNRNRRRYYDLVGNYKVTDEVNLGLYTFTSTEEGLAPLGGTAWVNGITGYVQAQLSDKFWLNVRQEFYNDPFGIRSGFAARYRAFTLTPEYRITPDWTVRMDIRFDKASNPVYETGGRPINYQKSLFFQQTLRF